MYDAWLKATNSISDKCPFKSFPRRCNQCSCAWSSTNLLPKKTSRSKTGGAQKYFNFHSLKNYTADCYREALKHIDFPNYKHFGDVNEVDSNLTVIDKIASYKSKRVKGNNQKLFDGEVLEKLILRNKLFKTFKKSKLHIIKNYIKNQNWMP